MDTSVDKFYARAFKHERTLPEYVLVQVNFYYIITRVGLDIWLGRISISVQSSINENSTFCGLSDFFKVPLRKSENKYLKIGYFGK